MHHNSWLQPGSYESWENLLKDGHCKVSVRGVGVGGGGGVGWGGGGGGGGGGVGVGVGVGVGWGGVGWGGWGGAFRAPQFMTTTRLIWKLRKFAKRWALQSKCTGGGGGGWGGVGGLGGLGWGASPGGYYPCTLSCSQVSTTHFKIGYSQMNYPPIFKRVALTWFNDRVPGYESQ